MSGEIVDEADQGGESALQQHIENRLDRHHSGKLNGSLPPSGKRFTSEQSHWFRAER